MHRVGNKITDKLLFSFCLWVQYERRYDHFIMGGAFIVVGRLLSLAVPTKTRDPSEIHAKHECSRKIRHNSQNDIHVKIFYNSTYWDNKTNWRHPYDLTVCFLSPKAPVPSVFHQFCQLYQRKSCRRKSYLVKSYRRKLYRRKSCLQYVCCNWLSHARGVLSSRGVTPNGLVQTKIGAEVKWPE